MEKLKYCHTAQQSYGSMKSVKSKNLCKSVIQTILSYDIVKVHGGELKVETKEGEGSEFIIQIPITL